MTSARRPSASAGAHHASAASARTPIRQPATMTIISGPATPARAPAPGRHSRYRQTCIPFSITHFFGAIPGRATAAAGGGGGARLTTGGGGRLTTGGGGWLTTGGGGTRLTMAAGGGWWTTG